LLLQIRQPIALHEKLRDDGGATAEAGARLQALNFL